MQKSGPIPELKKIWSLIRKILLYIGENLSLVKRYQTSMVRLKKSWEIWGGGSSKTPGKLCSF